MEIPIYIVCHLSVTLIRRAISGLLLWYVGPVTSRADIGRSFDNVITSFVGWFIQLLVCNITQQIWTDWDESFVTSFISCINYLA